MSDKKQEKQPGIGYAVPFFLALAVLTVVAFCIPLRPEVSYSEKRELTKFPEFSLSALVSGDYFDDITLWFSDTFPGRESWIRLSDHMSSFHGYSEIAIDGDLILSDEIPPSETAPAAATEPEEAPETASTEAASAETTAPAEEEWGGVDAGAEEIALGAVIQIGDAAFNQLGFSHIQSDKYAATVSKFADKMAEQGVSVISAPAPTAIGVMVEAEYLEQLNCARQDEMISYMHGSMSDNVRKVDTFSNLVDHNDEYLYFRTDHHWTARGAYYAYEALCLELGYEAAPLDSFEEWDQGEFVGSIYGKSRWPTKLTKDTLYCYVPQGDITMMAYRTSDSIGQEWPLIADRTKDANSNSRYSAFLGADCALAHVVNESLPDGPNCIVVKDSFGNCFVPYLTQNYHNIYAIDYRKYRRMTLSAMVEAYDIDEVIFAPYLTATQSIDGNSFFEMLCR